MAEIRRKATPPASFKERKTLVRPVKMIAVDITRLARKRFRRKRRHRTRSWGRGGKERVVGTLVKASTLGKTREEGGEDLKKEKRKRPNREIYRLGKDRCGIIVVDRIQRARSPLGKPVQTSET